MLKTMSSFRARAHVRMFCASSRLVAKIVDAIPNEKFGFFAASACMASMVWQAFSKPRLTSRTWLWTSPMPSSDTRMLMSSPLAAQNSTMRVSIGIARFGVRPVVLMPILRKRGSRLWNISTMSGRSLRVVGSPPEMLRFSTAPQNSWSKAPSTSASVMSSLRLPRFQLLHIVQRASQTKVQL